MAIFHLPCGRTAGPVGHRGAEPNRDDYRAAQRSGWAARRPLRRHGPRGVTIGATLGEGATVFFARLQMRMPGDPRHIAVLGPQAVAMLSPRAGGLYIDATFGAGG